MANFPKETVELSYEEKVKKLGLAAAALLHTHYDSPEPMNPPRLLEMIIEEYEKLNF